VPRQRNPEIGRQLLDAAARILAEEGEAAVTARRLGAEVGTSTMAVYTNFGGMDELLLQVWRDGFARFGAALDAPPTTADPMADFIEQGWGYRRFALENRHLYRIMFGDGLVPFRFDDPADQQLAQGTFESLLGRLREAAALGRLQIDDLELAGQVVWSTVHGHMAIELTGYFEAREQDPVPIYEECLRRLGLGFGDRREELERSLTRARRRVSRRCGRGSRPRPSRRARGARWPTP
jgi:AcrR family transcriptional regulator